MIKVVRTGTYRLDETKTNIKLLVLDGKTTYEWIIVKGVNELFVTSKKLHQTDSVLAMGTYRLYDVKDELQITGMKHLELLVGKRKWQGYLLLTGFPKDKEKRVQIIPTGERITCSVRDCWAIDYPTSSFSRSPIL